MLPSVGQSVGRFAPDAYVPRDPVQGPNPMPDVNPSCGVSPSKGRPNYEMLCGCSFPVIRVARQRITAI